MDIGARLRPPERMGEESTKKITTEARRHREIIEFCK